MGHSDIEEMTSEEASLISLNPCSNGWGTLTTKDDIPGRFVDVLILVLMDGAL